MEHRVNTLLGASLFVLLPCASEWGSYGFFLDNYNGSIIVEESVMSEIEFSLRNITAPYTVFVLHKPTGMKHFITICRLHRLHHNCTSSDHQVCQCSSPDHFRLTRTFKAEDTGQLLFQLFNKTSLNKLVNISVKPKTTTTKITSHQSRMISLLSSRHSTPVEKWMSSSLSATRKPMSSSSGNDVKAAAAAQNNAVYIIAVTVAMLCISAVAIVSSVVMAYRLRSLRQQARGIKPEGDTFDVPGHT